MKDRYPDLDLRDLQRHVYKMGKRVRDEHEHRRDQPEYGREHRQREYEVSDRREQEEQRQRLKRVWRNPRQPEGPLPVRPQRLNPRLKAAASSSGGNPVKLEATEDHSHGEGVGYN